jgi:hypothetical protein
MEQSREPVAVATPPGRMELQSIEDFEKEMDALDAVKARNALTKPPQPLSKKPKRTIDAEAVSAEQRAREEIGNENWVGKLLGLFTLNPQAFLPINFQYLEYRNAHPVTAISGAQSRTPPGLTYKEDILNSGIIRFAYTVEIAETSKQFGGVELSFSNKKDAKRWAAKKAFDWLMENNYVAPNSNRTITFEALEAERAAREEIGNDNWVGKLLGLFISYVPIFNAAYSRYLEYRNAHPVAAPSGAPPNGAIPGLSYNEIPITSGIIRFAYEIEIGETSQLFGRTTLSFSNKKDAKQYAAKKAIDWLIANNHMPSDGSARFQKPPPPVPMPQPKKRKSDSPSAPGTSSGEGVIKYASLIPPLCGKLGFGPPQYEIARTKDDDLPFFNTYALFPGNPIIEGKVGEVFNVYGQKNAKEECAAIVYSFLKDIERQRGEQLDIDNKKRKRSSEVSE